MEQKVDKINLKMFSLYFKLDKFFVLFKFNPRNLIDLFIEVFVEFCNRQQTELV